MDYTEEFGGNSNDGIFYGLVYEFISGRED